MGADLLFAREAVNAGMRVTMWTFHGHNRPKLPLHVVIRVLSPQGIVEADSAIRIAGSRLGRTAKFKPYTENLLRRNFAITRDATTLYAVGTIAAPPPGKETNPLSVNVSGGTGWSCQMFADKYIEDMSVGSKIILPMFLFDQGQAAWYQCFASRDTTCTQLTWQKLTLLCKPSGVFAGVGTRQLNDAGRNAIIGLFN